MMKAMSTSKLCSLFGASILRTHQPRTFISRPLPLRFAGIFPSQTLRFRRYCASAVTLDPDTSSSSSSEDVARSPPHPWPEWIDFVDRLKSKGYLSNVNSPSPSAAPESNNASTDEAEAEAENVYSDMYALKQACISFARDRFDLIPLLSRQDLQTVVEKGCPNLLRKAVNSAKRLRAYLHLKEEDVCIVCALRDYCDRANAILDEPETAARTVDIVRLLLIYALDPATITGKELTPSRELIEESVKILLRQLVDLSNRIPDPEIQKRAAEATPNKKISSEPVKRQMRPESSQRSRGDWVCQNCNFMNFARNQRCLKCRAENPMLIFSAKSEKMEITMKKGDWNCPNCDFMNFARNQQCFKCAADRPETFPRPEMNIEMKKGDWNCPKCGFMNFAKNLKCRSCREPIPKRPGSWECPSCDFLNYSGNEVCKRCNSVCPEDVKAQTQYEDQTWRKPF